MKAGSQFLGIAILVAFGILFTTVPGTAGVADDDDKVSLSITVKGKETEAPIKNAAIYVKFKEKHRMRRDTKREWSLKTDPEGHVRFPNLPEGQVLIQIVAEGWRPYGKFHNLEAGKIELEIELERPPKWF